MQQHPLYILALSVCYVVAVAFILLFNHGSHRERD